MTEEQEIQYMIEGIKKEITETFSWHYLALTMNCVPQNAKYQKTIEYFTWIDAELKKPVEEMDLEGIESRMDELDKMSE